MDEFSRLTLVDKVKTTAGYFVLPKMDIIFSQLGIPTDLDTDNGPPFNGQKFEDFCEYYRINHRNSMSAHLPSNRG